MQTKEKAIQSKELKANDDFLLLDPFDSGKRR